MRARTVKKLERELRAKLLDAATRLVSTAEAQAAEGRPHLLRTITAIAHSTAASEATKKRLELTEGALEMKAELEQIKLDREADDGAPVRVDVGDMPRPNRERTPASDQSPDGHQKPLATAPKTV